MPCAAQALADRAGRIWRWNPELVRRPGDPPGAFCHRGQVRTEREIAHEAEPIIEVRDPRVLAVRLEPVPAHHIHLNDLVLLPGLGELSPVIGIWPSPDRYAHHLYVCTDNGDWAHRSVDSSLLRADIRTPSRPGRPAVAPAVIDPTTRPQAPHPHALTDERQRNG